MASLLDPSIRSLMDLGCGMQECKKYLSDDVINYYPVDQHKHLSSTIVKDLNAGDFLEKEVDVCFVSGFFEYVFDLESLIEKIANIAPIILCSYCNTDDNPSRLSIWVNHYSNSDFICLIEKHGYSLKKEILKNAQVDHIYYFVKQDVA